MCQAGCPISGEAGRLFTGGCFAGRLFVWVNQVAPAPPVAVLNETANATASEEVFALFVAL